MSIPPEIAVASRNLAAADVLARASSSIAAIDRPTAESPPLTTKTAADGRAITESRPPTVLYQEPATAVEPWPEDLTGPPPPDVEDP